MASSLTVESQCNDTEIRLVDGPNDFEGRVEICFGGVWGTVCDDLWDRRVAEIVCQQLGFSFSCKHIISISM